MAYLVNTNRQHSLTVNGIDVSDRMISFQVSDDSVFRNGLVTTTGTIELATVWNELPAVDYGYGEFRRGQRVVMMVEQDGVMTLHPRGTLRVLSSSYSPESESTLIDVGCEIAYAKLLNKFDDYKQYAPYTLDPATDTFEGLSGCLAAVGKYIYQDATGAIVTQDILASGTSFNSSLQQTALSVTPLGGGEPVPDKINLSYERPSDSLDDQGDRLQEIQETESYYYSNYPGQTFTRVPDDSDSSIEDEINNGDLINEGNNEIPDSTACGDVPPPNPELDQTDDDQSVVCSSEYSTESLTVYLPAFQYEVETTDYLGPAGQASYRVRETYAPLLEANSSYFADKYDYCRRVYGNGCAPDGDCPYYGTIVENGEDQTMLRQIVTTYSYGDANELVETVEDTFVTKLSICASEDWRSGTYDPVNGEYSGFDNEMERFAEMFRVQRVITVNDTPDIADMTSQTVTTWSSVTTRTPGLFTTVNGAQVELDIDALDGIETVEVNRTTTIAALDNSPERVTPEATKTETEETVVSLDSGAGDDETYYRDEDVPYPLLFDDREEAKRVADDYGHLLATLIIGDSRGLTISEAVNPGTVNGWFPTRPFMYIDDRNSRTVSLRMDATSWAVDAAGSVFVTAGMWMGNGTGNYTPGSNVTGNAIPNMDDGIPTAPENGDGDSHGGTDPEVPTTPVTGNFHLDIDVLLTIENICSFHGNNGVVPAPPSDTNSDVDITISCAVRGTINQPGGMVSGGPDGSLPADFSGSIIVDTDLVINSDLFA